MTYDEAKIMAKTGLKMSREKWLKDGNRTGTNYIMYITNAKASYRVGYIDIVPFIALAEIGGSVSVYSPSKEDINAKDWKDI